MQEIHPMNRPHMRAAYFAYLQNNPGSRKAVYECLKTMEDKSDKKDNDQDNEDNDGNTTARSRQSVKSKTSEKSSEKAWSSTRQ